MPAPCGVLDRSALVRVIVGRQRLPLFVAYDLTKEGARDLVDEGRGTATRIMIYISTVAHDVLTVGASKLRQELRISSSAFATIARPPMPSALGSVVLVDVRND